MLKIGAFVATPFLLIALFLGATGVVLVNVREGGPDGTHITVPVPLVLARAVLAVAPAEARHIQCEGIGHYRDIALEVADALQDCPDFTIAEIHQRDELVLVRKEGSCVVVDVQDPDEQVHCRVPLRSAAWVLASCDEDGFSTSSLIRAMSAAPRGDIVHVRDGQDEVRITKL
jgi:hypothetical protein